MTAMTVPRSLHSACEIARLMICRECFALQHAPCLRGDYGTRGYHVSRFVCARRAGLLSGEDLAAVLDDVEVLYDRTVVYDGRGS